MTKPPRKPHEKLARLAPVLSPPLVALGFGLLWYDSRNLREDIDSLSLFAGGIAFAVFAPVLLNQGRPMSYPWLVALTILGLLFPVWGMALGAATAAIGGSTGWPQGVVTALVLGWLTRSILLGGAVALCIIPAWLFAALTIKTLAFLQNRGLVTAGWSTFEMHDAAIAWWNISVSTAMGFWVLHQRRKRLLQRDDICKSCGYDLRGLRDPICPECGSVAGHESGFSPAKQAEAERSVE